MSDKTVSPMTKTILEFGPILGFFVAYLWLKDRTFTIGGTEYDGFVVVTAGFIPVFLVCMGVLWLLTRELSEMQIITAVLVIFFGALSVWFNDPRFFKMKPTIIYLLFGGVLGFGLLRGNPYLKYVMKKKHREYLSLSHEGWMILTRRLTYFFFGLAALNEVVWRTMSEETWVYFKTFGLTAAIFLFFMAQGKVFSEHSTDTSEDT